MDKTECHCGCGQLRDKYDKRGRPRYFIFGHQQSRPHTPESNLKNRLSHLGRIHSEATKKKMSDKHKGYIKTNEHRLNISKSLFKYGSKVWHRSNARKIIEQHIGRNLNQGEIVHHIDHNWKNNDLANLHLFRNESEHQKYHFMLRKSVFEELGIVRDSKMKKLCLMEV